MGMIPIPTASSIHNTIYVQNTHRSPGISYIAYQNISRPTPVQVSIADNRDHRRQDDSCKGCSDEHRRLLNLLRHKQR